MLIQLVSQQPEIIGPIVRQTPTWVWGLLAGLLALGLSQLRDRSAGLARVSIMPVAMSVLAVSGTFSAFGSTPLFAAAIAVWFATAATAIAMVLPTDAGARYDPATRRYALPGSVVPLLLIVGVFLVKYVVGVELAMAPHLVEDTQYAMTVAALYGAFSGIFIGRTARLWKLALQPTMPAGTTTP
jgi:hypothetical protein